MILQAKENTTVLNYSLYLLELYETPPKESLYYDSDERVYRNVISAFVNNFTNYKANHDNLTIWYNFRLELVILEVDVKDYIHFSKEVRADLQEITRTQLINLFGSGD